MFQRGLHLKLACSHAIEEQSDAEDEDGSADHEPAIATEARALTEQRYEGQADKHACQHAAVPTRALPHERTLSPVPAIVRGARLRVLSYEVRETSGLLEP